MVYTRNISDSIVWVGGSDRRLVGGLIACWHLTFASWIHTGRQREVIGRYEHAASLGCGSAHIFLE